MPELSSTELEERMRPGAWSMGGFVGPNESLETVVRLDAEVLALLGVTPRRIADSLEQAIVSGIKAEGKLMRFRASRKAAAQTEPPKKFNLFQELFTQAKPDHTAPRIEIRPNPLEKESVRCGFPFEHLRYSGVRYMGYQICPWGCGVCPGSDLDFRIENERAREVVKGPGLIVHLIREHQFFEGLESPYRVDPVKLVKLLELRPEFRVKAIM
jgi:hypothetical protein